jgi:hypothetical protein
LTGYFCNACPEAFGAKQHLQEIIFICLFDFDRCKQSGFDELAGSTIAWKPGDTKLQPAPLSIGRLIMADWNVMALAAVVYRFVRLKNLGAKNIYRFEQRHKKTKQEIK